MSPQPDEQAEARYLSSARAVRERCNEVLALGRAGTLQHWSIDESRLGELARFVAEVTREAYPDVRHIPYHGRYRHFSTGAVDRLAELDARLGPLANEERLMAAVELVVVSVLVDAGAGERWSYRDRAGQTHTRSEGLAVASFEWFLSGALSADPTSNPLRVDAPALETLSREAFAQAFQVEPSNPLLGLDGRVELLRALGRAARLRAPSSGQARLGAFGVACAARASAGMLPATLLLESVLEAFGDIWPGREVLAGRPLGDVWVHPSVGRVPFHKLSQWLTYSLCEPLEAAGLRITELEALTGLAEYRNGGLFVDGGVLIANDPTVLGRAHPVASALVVEWRALTVALLDVLAERLREIFGLTPRELPLARVLEGGTWRAGRALAAKTRAAATPPLTIESDGTVF